ncbi:MAG: hypothetical protein JW814_10970 [Candidatus Krumholzibacteriota bacterium]|nr:hypothetical protein [Candidatus Krumholzibacteriota bacterium]
MAINSVPLSAKILARSAIILVICLLSLHLLSSTALTQTDRRINIALLGSFSALDADYFGLDQAAGIDAAFRYEIYTNLYLESRLGSYACSGNGENIHGFNSQIGLIAFSSHFLPFRPGVRAAFALQSANPITVTPTDTFKPSQTTFYLVTGLNLGRYVWKKMLVEAGIDVLYAPYEYTIYRFDRQSVSAQNSQFVHYTFSLGASYSF